MSALDSTIATLFSSGPLGILIKITVVLCCAALCAFVMRGASAAMRHLIWLLGLVSSIGLAVLSPAAPTIHVRLPARTLRFDEPATAERIVLAPVTVAKVVVSTSADGQTIVAMPRLAAATTVAPQSADGPRLSGGSIAAIVIATWLVGFALVLARCYVGHEGVRRMIRGAGALSSTEWRDALDVAAFDLGLARPITLLVSEELSAPVTAGFLNPVVILPIEALEWDAERRHIVLVHEIAHVVRLDYLTQLIATFACALLWFHPAIWVAAARLRAEAEHAADDRVLDSGTPGVTYATHLLALARGGDTSQLSPAVAVGMIRSTRLEGRFRAMLDSTRPRAGVSRRLQAVAAALTMCAMIPIAGMRPVLEARSAPAIATPRAVTIRNAIAPLPATAATAIVVATPEAAAAPTPAPLGSPVAIASIMPAAVIATPADSSFEQTIDASNGERLTLDLRTGGAIALHGWDENRIKLVARLGGRDWRDTKVALDRTSGGARLRSEFVSTSDNKMTSHQFELWVPRHTDVSVSSAGGSLAINDLSGDFYGQTGGGGITIEGATGRATLSTGGGAVTVMNSNLSGSVTTGGGEVTISNVTGGLRGSSGTGTVTTSSGQFGPSNITRAGGDGSGFGGTAGGGTTIQGGFGGVSGGRRTSVTSATTTTTIGSGGMVTTTFPDGFATSSGRGFGGSAGGVSISKDGGNIVLDEAPAGAVLHTGGGRISVGSSSRSIRATTGGGDIELERVAGDAFASTGAGEVRISVVNVSGATHTIDVISGKGRVVLELPMDLDAQIELESAYTNNVGRRPSIESDFPLTESETKEWDDRFGTPRKYVRAVGTFGNGSGRIRVRTVNGDVVVKRVNR